MLPPSDSFPSAPVVYALAIYLGAFLAPGVGSTLAWSCGTAWSDDATLTVHYLRALRLQGVCLAAMLMVEGVVVGLLWFGFPWVGPDALRGPLVLLGLQQSAGLYLTMGLLGPLALLAEGFRAPPALAAGARPSSPRLKPTARSACTRLTHADRRLVPADRRIRSVG